MGNPDEGDRMASSVAVPVEITGLEAGLMPGGSFSETVVGPVGDDVGLLGA